jgi:two-component system CitB family response regulator
MLNLAVVYGSHHVGASIVHYLSQLRNLAIVGESCKVEDALQMLVARPPHVVIIDAHLKDGLGLDVLRRAKLLGAPPVVIMTAASSYFQYRRECMRHGADYYFQLPHEIDDMMNTLSQLSSLFSAVIEETKSGTELA